MGISQNVLGELADIDGTTIRKYELGSRKPKPDTQLRTIEGCSMLFYGLQEAVLPGVTCRNAMVRGKPFTAGFVSDVMMAHYCSFLGL